MRFILLGGLAGIIMIVLQWWTVQRVSTESPQHAMLLVVGGAVMRWILIAVILFIAFRADFVLGLLTFGSWWLARWFMLICIE